MRPEPTPPAGAGVRDLGERAACFRIQDVDHSATNLHVQLEGEPDSRRITRHCDLRIGQHIPLHRIGNEILTVALKGPMSTPATPTTRPANAIVPSAWNTPKLVRMSRPALKRTESAR